MTEHRPPKPISIAPNTAGDKKLFCFGYGYVAEALSQAAQLAGWHVSGTTRDPVKASNLKDDGLDICVFDNANSLCHSYESLQDVTHLLVSIPPDNNGDLVLELHEDDLAQLPNLEWIGYLSATSVYGNRNGGSVDENSEPLPTSKRGSVRLLAEQQWMNFYHDTGAPVHLFRLSGIYGPGRSALDTVRLGKSRRIDKPGHAFNRIHLDDIVQCLIASINNPTPGETYNLADDAPAPSHEVIAYACNLLAMDVPPLIPFEQSDLAPMVRSFYNDNKRILNHKIKDVLGVTLMHPDYTSGLDACFDAERELETIIDM